mmetsp:Transcript_54218/g.129200  ORF Transcript_54218/g.129200 Transcript_54218/m.129200 type:complete len:87 (+) Transcript_54218:412-672(+)
MVGSTHGLYSLTIGLKRACIDVGAATLGLDEPECRPKDPAVREVNALPDEELPESSKKRNTVPNSTIKLAAAALKPEALAGPTGRS